MSTTIDDFALSHLFSMRLCAIQSCAHTYINTWQRSVVPPESSHADYVAPHTAWHHQTPNGMFNFRDISSPCGMNSTDAITGRIMLKVRGCAIEYAHRLTGNRSRLGILRLGANARDASRSTGSAPSPIPAAAYTQRLCTDSHGV
jgi:hypothetical protein